MCYSFFYITRFFFHNFAWYLADEKSDGAGVQPEQRDDFYVFIFSFFLFVAWTPQQHPVNWE